jgi:ligand-binding sensor domain-containing protein/serine phosphatase RsbU (regulator of sigma subunit)
VRKYCSKPLLFINLLFIFFFLNSNAQHLQNHTVFQGKKSVKINCTLTDYSGLVWIGSSEGLFRYNGMDYKSIKGDSIFEGQKITALALGADSSIWIGTMEGKLFVHKHTKISAFSNKEFVDVDAITSIIQDSEKTIWIGSYGSGLIALKNNSIKKITTENRLSDDVVYTIFEDKKNQKLWIGTDGGISIYDLKTSTFSYLNLSNGLPDNIVKSLSANSNGIFYIAMQDSGICTYSGGKFSKLLQEQWEYGAINSLLIDSYNTLWVGTESNGLISIGSRNGSPILRLMNTQNGLSGNSVTGLSADREQNIWIATQSGLTQYCRSRFEYISTKNGLPSNKISALTVDKQGNYWICSDVGLTKFKYLSNGKTEVRTFLNRNENSKQLISIFLDSKDNLWIGTYGDGVYKFNIKTETSTLLNEKEGITNGSIISIVEDNQHAIWLASIGSGVYKIDAENPTKVINYNEKNGLSGSYIYEVFKDSKGNIWIATDGNGINKFDGKSFVEYGIKEGLINKTIFSIAESKDGSIFCNNYENGIYKFDGKAFSKYAISESLTELTPSILACAANSVIVATNLGIDVLHDNLINSYKLFENEGGLDPTLNARFLDAENYLYIGSSNGIVKYKAVPDSIDLLPPLVQLENLKVLFEDYPVRNNEEFTYEKNHFVFEYFAISHKNPNAITYKYKLEGFDQDWNNAGNLQLATYSNLPPGEYNFCLMAANADGIWSEKYTFAFTIMPPIWNRWWFRLLSVLFLGFVIYYSVRYRILKLKGEKKVLEARVENRTKEINDQKSIIEKKNKDIMDSIEYAKRIQEAILPSTKFIQHHLPESFVLYKPKDIVSGDFYWAYAYKDPANNKITKFLIAAVDCTGHGVPGAFMSMIGSNTLTQLVAEKGIVSPKEILNELNTSIKKALRQKDGQKDGMDIAICCIDFEKRELTYAAALRPLFHFRDSQLIEIEPDKTELGSYEITETSPFTNHTIKIQVQDIFYIFTDGYTDQFGGVKDKKYMVKNFKRTLSNMQSRTMKEQEELLNNFYLDWRGNKEQVDDILVIGFKIP